jgi:CRP-like cAMP-binding protein
MSVNAKQIQKINYFSKVSEELCSEVAKVVKQKKCSPKTTLLKEGETGDTMLLIFQGQVEVSKNMMVKTSNGFTMSTKSIIRLETTDPSPANKPITVPTVSVVKAPAFGIGEFSLVLDDAKRTSHVTAMTDINYGIIQLEDFSKIVAKHPSIGGSVYFEVAKSAVNNLATATQDISNLTQAFFFALAK